MKRIISVLLYSIVCLIVTNTTIHSDIKSVATVTGLDKTVNLTLPAPYSETVSAGTFKATIDNSSTSLYCIDISHPLAFNEAYKDVEQTNDVLSYILNNYYPYKSTYTGALNPIEKEAAAVQLAIWSITDNLDITKVTNVDAAIKTRAIAIASDAALNANSFNLNTFSIIIPPQSFNYGAAITFSVQAFNQIGLAMPNVQITLSSSAGILSSTTTTTGQNGVTPVLTLTPTGNMTSAIITATGVVGIPSGTKYFHSADPNGKQKLILAKPTTATRTITRGVGWSEPVNLSVNKVADKTTINNGDLVKYTIKITNSGGSTAQGVEVSDQLQSNLQFISSTAAGLFNSTTGIWTVGDLAAGESKTIEITVKANLSSSSGPAFNLGAAIDYNMFIIDTLIQPSSDTEGKLAVGAYAELSNYSVGDKLQEHSGDVLIVGGHLHFLHGRVYNGKAIYGNFITSTTAFTADDSIYKKTDVVNFAAAKVYLEDLSNQLSSLAENGTQKLEYGELALTGTDATLNVFKVDGSKISKINNFAINVPTNSAVLVNIYGDITSWSGGFSVNGTSKENVLLNFYNSANIKVSNIEIQASILAPKTRITFPSGLISGQVIAKCLFGQVQVNNFVFGGKIQSSTTIANVANIVNASQANNSIPMSFAPSIALGNRGVTSVKSTNSSVPKEFKIEQNYPNPFNPSTSIAFAVAKKEFVSVSIYEMTGRLVKTLINEELEAGTYSVIFNASGLSSGIYLYRFNSNSYNAVKKMVLIK